MASMVNSLLTNDGARAFLVVLTGALAAYTITPLPMWLNDLLSNSDLFKGFIVFVIALLVLRSTTLNSTSRPDSVDTQKLVGAAVLAVVMVFGFKFARTMTMSPMSYIHF